MALKDGGEGISSQGVVSSSTLVIYFAGREATSRKYLHGLLSMANGLLVDQAKRGQDGKVGGKEV